MPTKGDEYMKELTVGFLTNGSCFANVIEGPASAKISETTKQHQLNRGRIFSGGIFAHPTAKPESAVFIFFCFDNLQQVHRRAV